MLGDTSCAQGSQKNDPAASVKTKDDPSAAAARVKRAPEVGRAFIKFERRKMTEDFRTDEAATTLQTVKAAKVMKTGKAVTTYLPTRCINSLSVKETHRNSYALYIANIPELFSPEN